mmetsp:Transcript_63031/g.179136  ORF Transcript_63031/g.179136 Transcript_63031/m.179136 type:complete len:357 (+) Transcript_63031:245-1315(+)
MPQEAAATAAWPRLSLARQPLDPARQCQQEQQVEASSRLQALVLRDLPCIGHLPALLRVGMAQGQNWKTLLQPIFRNCLSGYSRQQRRAPAGDTALKIVAPPMMPMARCPDQLPVAPHPPLVWTLLPCALLVRSKPPRFGLRRKLPVWRPCLRPHQHLHPVERAAGGLPWCSLWLLMPAHAVDRPIPDRVAARRVRCASIATATLGGPRVRPCAPVSAALALPCTGPVLAAGWWPAAAHPQTQPPACATSLPPAKCLVAWPRGRAAAARALQGPDHPRPSRLEPAPGPARRQAAAPQRRLTPAAGRPAPAPVVRHLARTPARARAPRPAPRGRGRGAGTVAGPCGALALAPAAGPP